MGRGSLPRGQAADTKVIEQELRGRLEALGVEATEAQYALLVGFGHLLLDRGVPRGVLGKNAASGETARHLADSASCLISGRFEGSSGAVVDVGSGGGLPGLALAILRPSLRFLLVDATRKKVDFLDEVCEALQLGNVKTRWARIEEVGRDRTSREKYDLAVARAVGVLAVVEEYALPLLRVGGTLVAQKGRLAREELAAGRRAAAALGGDRPEVVPLPAVALDRDRCLVLVTKTGRTSDVYPRRPGVPGKRPLGAETRRAHGDQL